jgi:hypothetical protein
MPHRHENPGTCAYCGEVITKRGVSKHLNKCHKWQETLVAAEASSRPVETLWHLRVQDAYDKDFWLDLEMRGQTPLSRLDDYLRAIWLECWGGTKVGKSRKANAAFEPGLVLRHLYDFGTTSETDIKVVGFREGKATSKHPIALLARNLQPEAVCMKCDQPAGWLCLECLDEPGTWFLCNKHMQDHPHEEYGEPIALVNSPRLGMCGYEGPAEPPY